MTRSSRWLLLPLIALVMTACGGGGGGSSDGVSSSTSSTSSSSSGSSTSSSSSSSSSGSSTSSSSSSGAASSSSSGGHNFSGGGPNVVAMIVGPGPVSNTAFNIPSTSVTVCLHGTSNCKTITNVLVDTGSYGLRLLASALSGLSAPEQPDPNISGHFMVECQQFLDGYTWGPVAIVDVKIGQETASDVPINVLDDVGNLEPAAPSSCTNGGSSSGSSGSSGSSSSGGSSGSGTNLSTASALGANGVLGVGYLQYDCGPYCTYSVSQQTVNNVFLGNYYSCSSSSCSPSSESLQNQVVNPVALFSVDNNGVILQLPAIAPTGQQIANGYLVFGIGTSSNNSLNGATVLTIDSTTGNISTTFNGQTLPNSFLDSGSNGYFFPDSSIAVCPSATDFYCPSTSPLTLLAANTGVNGQTTDVSLQIINVDDRNTSFYAIDVGGPDGTGLSSAFDFGLPFFYGRTVFTAIEGMNADGTTGPYWAY